MLRIPLVRRTSSRSALLSALLVGACDCGEGDGLVTRIGKARVEPESISFGDVLVGETALRVVTIGNIGNHELAIEELILSEPELYTIAQRPTTPLDEGSETTLAVEFAPRREGPVAATLEIITDDVLGSHIVQITGNGVVIPPPPPTCSLTVDPPAIQYASVQLGASAERTATLTNVSSAECAITTLQVTGSGAADFTLLDPNPGTLAAGAVATIRIQFSRSTTTERAADFEVTSNDATTPIRRVPLLTGDTRPGLCVMPASIHFATTSGTAQRDITLTACGDHDVAIEGLDFTTADPEIGIAASMTVPFTIPVGTSQTVTVEHTPADQMDDRAILTVRSNDPLVPTVDVEITGTADIVPVETGRYLYFWTVNSSFESNIVRAPLQGGGNPVPYWGQSTGESGCPGCHQVSPDGRYLAIIEIDVVLMTTYVVDTMTDTRVALPIQLTLGSSFSWRPDETVSPTYQFAVGVRGDIRLGSVTGGFIGDLAGASDPNVDEAMPSWGPNGEIVFVRGTFDSAFSGFGFSGAADMVLVPEGGGTAIPLSGASQNGFGNYYPAYSPSGQWISFTQSRAGGSTYAADDAQVRLVATDRSGTVLDLPLINGTNGSNSFPTWSMDGTYLSISSNRSGGVGDWDIYIAPIDELTGMELGAPTNLATANTSDFEHAAQWSP